MFKKAIALFIKPFASNRLFNGLFYLLYRFSILGWIGDEWDFRNSGELRFVRKFAEQVTGSIIIFDIGANEGHYAKALISVFQKQSTANIILHAFEPAAETYNKLCQQIGRDQAIVCNNFGLGEQNEELILYKRPNSSGLASLHSAGKFELQLTEKVQIRTIDSYCTDNSINRIHFLKMDVEGHELSVLKGASSMLEKQAIDVIQFEFGACNIGSRTYFKDFYDLLHSDFTIYRILKNGLVRVHRYTYHYEIFGRVMNYVAISKSVDWN